MNATTLRTPRGNYIEGNLNGDHWTPTSGLGLTCKLHVLLANGWTHTESHGQDH